MSDVRELIERLEKLEGPSREVDAAIADVFDPWDHGSRWPFSPGSKMDRALARYTGSLDAIVGLIEQKLPGEGIVLETHAGNRAGIGQSGRFPSKGATPAIALCIALLRALEKSNG